MNAPYDGDRGRAPGDGSEAPEDPYVQDAYARDPYRQSDPTVQDPVSDALYDSASHPPPPPGSLPDPHTLYEQPQPGPHTPDPQRWAPTPAPEPDGPSRRLPYGDDASTVQFTGIDGLLDAASGPPDAPAAGPGTPATAQGTPGAPGGHPAPGGPVVPGPGAAAAPGGPGAPGAPGAQGAQAAAAGGAGAPSAPQQHRPAGPPHQQMYAHQQAYPHQAQQPSAPHPAQAPGAHSGPGTHPGPGGTGQGTDGAPAQPPGPAPPARPEQPSATGSPAARPEPNDAFAHLFRDQGHNPAHTPGPGQSPGPGRQGATSATPPPPQQHLSPPPMPENGRDHGRDHGLATPGPDAAQAAEAAGPTGAAADTIPAEATAAAEAARTAETAEAAETGESAAPAKSGGGLLKSSAIMAAGTMVSRLTGFIRSAMVVAAVGAAVLGDTYQLAITLPTMLYVLTVGGGLNSVFVPQLVRAMKEDKDGGEAYANRLLTLVTVILGLLAVAAVFAAPLLVRAMSVRIAENPAANEVAVTFVRYCMPSIFFMGIHVVMGQILNARGRFGAMMWTPVLNNIVIIGALCMFLWVYGTASSSELTVESIPPEGVRLLGVGTLLGLVVQALAMVPYLRAAGFRIRPRFDWRGHGLGKAARLAKWTVLFVLANQAGVLVVSQLSTWAGESAAGDGNPGTGFIAYSNAQLIWNMPQAIITVSVMTALLPRLSRAASDGDNGAVRDDMSQGLRNSAVAIVPIAFGFVALGVPMCTMIYGASGLEAARSMGYALMAFGVGLIPFSVQYVVLRAFYAYEDTRTPFFNTVIVAVVNAVASTICFFVLPARWAVVGMAFSYGLAYVIGVGVAWRRLRVRLGGDLDGSHVLRTYIRLAGASVPATVAAGAAAYGITQGLGSGTLGSLTAVLAGGIVLGAVFVLAAKRMRIEELTAMVGAVRARLGR